jgi:hypothetical protein
MLRRCAGGQTVEEMKARYGQTIPLDQVDLPIKIAVEHGTHRDQQLSARWLAGVATLADILAKREDLTTCQALGVLRRSGAFQKANQDGIKVDAYVFDDQLTVNYDSSAYTQKQMEAMVSGVLKGWPGLSSVLYTPFATIQPIE